MIWADIVTPENKQTIAEIQAENAESEAIQAAVMQYGIWAVTTVVMALREADTGPIYGASRVNTGEACSHRHGRPAIRQPSFI